MSISHSGSAGSSRALPIALVGALVGAALFFSWFLSSDRGTSRSETPIGFAEPEPEPAPTEDDPVVSTPVAEGADPELRSEIAVAEPDSTASTESATAEEASNTVSVLVSVDSLPWLAEGAAEGKLQWKEGNGGHVVRFNLEPKGGMLTATIELSSAPTSREEFSKIAVAGFLLQPLALRPVEPALSQRAGAPEFELLLEWAQGPLLVWADSVPQGERSLVNVAIGGFGEPRSREEGIFEREGLVQVRYGVELPLRLPKLKRKESVWVGAPSRVWRSFVVAMDATQIEVALREASSIRVLHDIPKGSTPQYVVVTALPIGETDIKPVSTSGVVEFTERPVGEHKIWIASDKEREGGKRLSRLAIQPLTAGEMTVVDLTSEYANKEFGTLRVRVVASPETLLEIKKGKSKDGLVVDASRRAPAANVRRWESAGRFLPVDDESSGAQVFEMTGLKPGLHRATVKPTGHLLTHEVVAGEVHVMEVSLDDFGWIQLVLPDGHPETGVIAFLSTAEPAQEDRAYVQFGSGLNHGLEAARLTAPGRYTVSINPFPSVDVSPLTSDEFVVQAGETTEVVLKAQSSMSVEVVAQDAGTDEPVGLDLKFWLEVVAVGSQTGTHYRGSTSFGGTLDAYTKITWQLDEVDEPVEIQIPENPFWEFEKVEPLRLEDGTKIVLRAIRKGS